MAEEEKRRRVRVAVGVCVGLGAVELVFFGLIWLSWFQSYLSWDPQSYGDPPAAYQEKSLYVAAAAGVAVLVAAAFRSWRVVIGQVITGGALLMLAFATGSAAQGYYESSYESACHAGGFCDAPAPAR
ncbi:hypothetical protein DMH26_00495 [Streptomyces sp. WAC 05379]|uniref:hypothetical protein n=1 Tax=Streptomyces sp. WAC 05379 TaxID=2203207 RepID=UPI000F7491B5|nr:hypothetical protein [Streptomyces sp. WAC 05379]RSO10009.1 hypothetical protein DMH26_00495 [Streptomyces sp. WAC 05379]